MHRYLFGLMAVTALAVAMSMPAEAEDTLRLSPVEVFARRAGDFAAGAHTISLEPWTIHQSAGSTVTGLLAEYSNVTIRQYGFGGMSNISMRGGYSNQTAVLWNGFSLNDPLNGGVNLSLFPAYFIDGVTMHRGGETALFGGGAMSGSVNMTTRAGFNKGLTADLFLGAGSFGARQQGLSAGFSGKKAATKIKLYHSAADNDFPFVNTAGAGSPLQYQANAATETRAFLWDNIWQPAKNQRVTADVWYNNSYNEVPANMSGSGTDGANMLNRNLRLSAGYALYRGRHSFKLRSAYFHNDLEYHNPAYLQSYRHRSAALTTEGEYHWKAKQTLAEAGLSHNLTRGLSESFAGEPQRQSLALFASVRQQIKEKTVIKANLRQEFQQQYKIPLTWSLSVEYSPAASFLLFATAAATCRVPTFNDLYWNDAWSKGNPGLRPEKGYHYDAGLRWQNRSKNSRLTASVFWAPMKNLIQWVPVQNVWMPQNVESVNIKGVDVHLSTKLLNGKKQELNITGGYVFTRSLLGETDYTRELDIAGKTLIYNPEHQANVVLNYRYKGWTAGYNQRFTSRVYTTASNSEWLPGRFPANFSAGFRRAIKNMTVEVVFKINNVWNETYQVMPDYAMPGRYFEGSLRFIFQQKQAK